MRRILNLVSTALGLPGDVALWVALLGGPGTLAAMTAWLAAQAGENLHWVVVACTVVFCSTLGGLYYFVKLHGHFRVFSQIVIDRVEALQADVVKINDVMVIRGLTLSYVLKNYSQRTMAVTPTRTFLAIQDRVRQGAKTNSDSRLIHPGSERSIAFATMPDIPMGDGKICGEIEIEVGYGPRTGRPKVSLSCLADVQIGYSIVDGKCEIRVATSFKNIKHSTLSRLPI
jgi:hypothetical protein